MMAFGSLKAGTHLTDLSSILSSVAGFAALQNAFDELRDSAIVPAGEMPQEAATLRGRLSAIGKLAEGHLHAMSETLSVVMGAADILQSSEDGEDLVTDGRRQAAAIERIAGVSDRLANQIGALRQINALSGKTEARLDLKASVMALPGMLAGLVKRIHDSKNLDIAVTAECEVGATIRSGDLYDIFLPILISVIEQAICSGPISVSAQRQEKTVVLTGKLRRKLIGHIEPGDLLSALFPHSDHSAMGDSAGELRLENTILNYHATPDECVLSLTVPCDQPSSETAGHHRLEPKRNA